MRRSLLCSGILTAVCAAAQDPSSLLSSLKRESLQLDEEKNRYDSRKLRWSWVNPLHINYLDSRNDQFDRTQRRRELSVTVDQPIFKSGGIWAAVKYAGRTEEIGVLGVEQARRRLIKQVVAALFNFRKNRYQIQKQKLLIDNDRLDVERKKERYLSGDLDSGFLDQAILKKNRDTLNLYKLQDRHAQLTKQFRDLSDADPDTIALPTFRLMPKKRFLDRHIDLRLYRTQVAQKDDYTRMIWARYLPTLSVQAGYAKPFENSFYFTGGNLHDTADSYHTYGFRVSMPLDVNSYADIESARVDLMRAKVTMADRRREADNSYTAVLARLKALDRMIALSREDAKLYASLVASTAEKVAAGELTEYDLATMRNAKKIRELDMKIFELDKQLVLLDLYEKSYDPLQ